MTYIPSGLHGIKSTNNVSTVNISSLSALNSSITNSQTTITLISTTEFETSGTIKIEFEMDWINNVNNQII